MTHRSRILAGVCGVAGCVAALAFGGAAACVAQVPPRAPQPACATSFECLDPSAPVCDAGVCGAGPAQCVDDDAADAGRGDDGPAVATPLTGTIAGGAICNQPATESDFYRVTIANPGIHLLLSLAWDDGADLDLAVYDAAGRMYGESLHRQPEDIDVRRLAAGDYLVTVTRRAAAAIATAVPYTLTATQIDLGAFCEADSDCRILWTSTGLYRSRCLALGCGFEITSGGAAGTSCDKDANCASGHCSYTAFESDSGGSVCTQACASDADCAAVPGAPICSSGRAPNVCLPGCVADLECGADPRTKPADAGLPWDYYSCAVPAQRCGSWMFKDGFEGGDLGPWSDPLG